jgi:AraC-like DNA-binding protein
MVYREFSPTSFLKDFVEAFWTLQAPSAECIDYRSIFPDGCADILFNFGYPLQSRTNGAVSLNSMRCFLVGTMTHSVLSKPTRGYDLLGVRFRPGGLFAFLKIPLSEFTNNRIDIGTFPGFQDIYEQLVDIKNTEQRIAIIEKVILANVRPSNPLVLWSVQQLEQSNGVVSISQLALKANVTQKKLERLFHQAVGISPKSLAGVFQFMKSKKLLGHSQSPDLLAIALACGYYDHAHFTKSFKRYTGISPDEFKKGLVV